MRSVFSNCESPYHLLHSTHTPGTCDCSGCQEACRQAGWKFSICLYSIKYRKVISPFEWLHCLKWDLVCKDRMVILKFIALLSRRIKCRSAIKDILLFTEALITQLLCQYMTPVCQSQFSSAFIAFQKQHPHVERVISACSQADSAHIFSCISELKV